MGGSETTYFDASSNVLGKKWSDSHTYTDENGTAQTSSHVSYSKANGDILVIVGLILMALAQASSLRRQMMRSGTITGAGVNTQYFEESGTSSWKNPAGETETMSSRLTTKRIQMAPWAISLVVLRPTTARP